MATDVRTALVAARATDAVVTTVLAPAWTSDWMSEDGKRKLDEFGIAPPVARAGVCPIRAGDRPCRARSAGRATPAAVPVRCHAVQGAVRLPGLPGTLRLLQGALTRARSHHRRPAAQARPVPSADRARGAPAHRGLDRGHLRGAGGARRRVRLRAGPVPRAPRPGRRQGHAPQLLDLRGRRCRGRFGSRSRRDIGGVFSSWANKSLQAGDVLEVMSPQGTFTTDIDPTSTKHYAAVVAGQRRDPDHVAGAQHPAHRAARPVQPGLLEPHRDGRDVPRGTRRPQGPLPVPVRPVPRAHPGGAQLGR